MKALSPAHIAANEICARRSGPLNTASSAVARERSLDGMDAGTARLSQADERVTEEGGRAGCHERAPLSGPGWCTSDRSAHRAARIGDRKDLLMVPTIVLVHGAFAESASWDRVIDLLPDEHRVIAAANPLRRLASDAESVSDLVRTIDGPVLLVAHSYGGAVISNVAPDAGEIAGLVYICGFAPDAGEDAFGLSLRFPGSTLGDAVQPVMRSGGDTDLYIAPDRFHEQFCADVPEAHAARMAVTQRPATLQALQEPSGEPLWKTVPSWFLIGGQDRNIPPALQHFMADRAQARRTIELPTASHAAAVSNPDATAQLILEAAAARVAA
jgi:pimeloyl-ACP methyl ester carboxylesterase